MDARLLVSDMRGDASAPTGRPQDAYAQATHGVLFRQWAPLRQEVEARAEHLRRRAELERWAEDGESADRSDDYLLTGDRLSLATVAVGAGGGRAGTGCGAGARAHVGSPRCGLSPPYLGQRRPVRTRQRPERSSTSGPAVPCRHRGVPSYPHSSARPHDGPGVQPPEASAGRTHGHRPPHRLVSGRPSARHSVAGRYGARHRLRGPYDARLRHTGRSAATTCPRPR